MNLFANPILTFVIHQFYNILTVVEIDFVVHQGLCWCRSTSYSTRCKRSLQVCHWPSYWFVRVEGFLGNNRRRPKIRSVNTYPLLLLSIVFELLNFLDGLNLLCGEKLLLEFTLLFEYFGLSSIILLLFDLFILLLAFFFDRLLERLSLIVFLCLPIERSFQVILLLLLSVNMGLWNIALGAIFL